MHTSQFMTFIFPVTMFAAAVVWGFFQRRGN
jgi:hypothetical protein